ncbi:hypothetical protein H4S06_000383 [Coemansia sp. BCRC 34490]|nr:hypothetical protein H4S06_000383 [Coemansia sp. BCRC 34490]
MMMMREYRIKQTAAPLSSPGLSIARTANSQHRRRQLPAEPPLAEEERNSKRRRTAETKGPGIGIASGASTSTTTGGSSRGISISGTAAPKQPERRPAQHDGQRPRTQAPAASSGVGVGRPRSVFGYQMQQTLRSRMRETDVSAAGAGGTPMQQSTSSGHDAGSRRNPPGAGIAIARTARKRPAHVRKGQEQSSPRPS